MNVTDYLLAAFVAFGAPALFGLIFLSSVGVPFPSSLTLIASGSFAAQGELTLWQVIVLAATGAIAGDQLGYALARRLGRPWIERLSERLGGADRLRRAEALGLRWGGAGVFLSRWLVPSLGPWINLTSGITGYRWQRFLLWDVLGEGVWVLLYVLLGWTFSDRVQAVAEILGDLAGVILGLLLLGLIGWALAALRRAPSVPNSR